MNNMLGEALIALGLAVTVVGLPILVVFFLIRK
jgi:hypothetical protein